ncbi:GNAT family N-acetyltransferase [Actinoallomurus sp. NBC_01490]|uniref:GNAT family N-acetyltransferase n=1 Tax=Actinoallomurus sp. NBC_01490 TaxID=2903557 RepID=UPI002E32D7CD|nr:GNAT family N-acetyltransferase [Actinoallomurus sp. NBC_01490]
MSVSPRVELVVASFDDPIVTGLLAKARPRAEASAAGQTVVPRPRSGADPYGRHVPADAGVVFVVARRADVPDGPVGCAGLRRIADDTAEVERLYVRPPYRGQGISRLLLAGVEDLARRRGFAVVRLAAADLRVAGLYVSRGYVRIAPFGRRPGPSVCFEKSLLVTGGRPG